MKPPRFSYGRANSVEEAVVALSSNLDRDDDPIKVLAGGQSLVPLMNFRLARPSALLDINGIEELHTLDETDEAVTVGATYRHHDMEVWSASSSGWQACHDAVQQIGHVAVRNRGTLAGSIAHADPLAEWPALAVLFDGTMHVEGVNGERDIAAEDFFQGFFTTALSSEELLTHVTFHQKQSRYSASAFAEVSRQRGDFCLVAAAARVVLDDHHRISESRVVVSGLSDTPWRVRESEELLVSHVPDRDLFIACGELVNRSDRGRTDLHASAQYRRQVGASLVADVLATASTRAHDLDEDAIAS